MSEFRGLHNHERHMAFAVDGDGDTAWCQANCEHGAGTQCAVGAPCRCCLTAEVEALRADNADLSLHLKVAWAQVQRVRKLHVIHDDCPPGLDCAGRGMCRGCGREMPCATIRALDGDGDE